MSWRPMYLATVCLWLVAASVCFGKSDATVLGGWKGKWVSAAALIGDPAMEPACEAVAEVALGYSADDVASFMASCYATSFDALEIGDGAIAYYRAEGVMPLAECEYDFAGVKMASFGEDEFPWYTFEARSRDAACAEYRYVVVTEVHAHHGGMRHWHMRYGEGSADELIHDDRYAEWWPTLTAYGTTAEQLAREMLRSPESFAAVLPVRLLTRVTTNTLMVVRDGLARPDTLELKEVSTEVENGRSKVCICRAVGFRIAQMMSGMWGDGAFHPADVSVVTGWSTHGAKEIFEDILGVAGFAYAKDARDSADLGLEDSWYEITILSTGKKLVFRGTDKIYSNGFLEARSAFKKGGERAAPGFAAGRADVVDAVMKVPFENMLVVED